MKRILTGVLVASCAMLLMGAVPMPVKTATPPKAAEVKGEGHHDLLSLDLREAAEHARVLNHYARTHPSNIEKSVVTKHLDELTRNLDGIREQLSKVQENMGTYSAATKPRLALIDKQEVIARQELEALKATITADRFDPNVITWKSQLIRAAMVTAEEHHRTIMAKRGVHEPMSALTKE